MTQQYLLGAFSSLLGELQPAAGERTAAVRSLRRQVESSAPSMLPRLASEAGALTETLCWSALERGDASGFARCADTAVELREFAANADLRPS